MLDMSLLGFFPPKALLYLQCSGFSSWCYPSNNRYCISLIDHNRYNCTISNLMVVLVWYILMVVVGVLWSSNIFSSFVNDDKVACKLMRAEQSTALSFVMVLEVLAVVDV